MKLIWQNDFFMLTLLFKVLYCTKIKSQINDSGIACFFSEIRF